MISRQAPFRASRGSHEQRFENRRELVEWRAAQDQPSTARRHAWLGTARLGALIVALGNETTGLRDRGEPIWALLPVATMAAVASVITGCALLVDSAGSTRRTVFRFHRLATVRTAIAVAASYSIVRMTIRPPFAHLLALGQFATSDIADLGCLVVELICLTFATVGLSETWIVYREERRWPEMLSKKP